MSSGPISASSFESARGAACLLLVAALAACNDGQQAPQAAPTGPVLAGIKVGARPATPTVGAGAIWVPNTGDGTVSEIDPKTNAVIRTIRIGDAAAFYRRRCEAQGSVHAFMGPTYTVRRCDLPSAVATGSGFVWATQNDARAIVALDPRDGHRVRTISVGAMPFELAAGDGAVWMTSYQDETVERIDPRTMAVVASITLFGQGPAGLAVAADAVWVTNSRGGTVLRIDPTTNSVVATIRMPCPVSCPYGPVPLAIAAEQDSIWVRNEGIATLTRIDPKTNTVVSSVDVDPFYGRDGVDAIAITPTGIWLSGLSLQRIDATTGRPAGKLNETGITLTYGDGALWVTSLLGKILRIDPAPASIQ